MPLREAWGLDIGQTALHAVKLRRTKGDGCEVADSFFFPMDTQLEDPDYNDKVLGALSSFMEEKAVGKTPVVVSLPGFTTLFRDFNMPAVSGSRLHEIVSYEAKQLIPYPLEEVVWDFHCLREDDDTGEVGIALVCCRKDIIESMLELLDEAGINVEALQVGPIAMVNYIQHEMPPEGATLILDTGARGTDFIIMNDGAFWLRSIGVSGTDLTKALMSKFSIPYEKAEELKLEVGDSKQGDRVFRVMEPTLRNLCGEVQRSVGYYKSLFRGVELTDIVCAGNTYLLSGVDQFLADNTGLPVRTLSVPEEIGIHFSVDEGEIEANRQILGTATGLALQGIGLADISTNLLPEDRRFAKFMQAKFRFAIGSVVAVALAVILGLLTAGSGSDKYDDVLKDIKTTQKLASANESKLKEIEALYPEKLEQNRALANVAQTRGYLNEAMAAILQPIEKLNRSPARKSTSEAKVRENITAELQKYLEKYPAVTIPGAESDPQVVERYEKLQERIIRQLNWVWSREGMVVVKESSFRIVMGEKIAGKETNKPYWRLAATGDNNTGTVDDNEPVGKPTELVEIELQGFVVTTSLTKAVDVKTGLSAIGQVVPFEFTTGKPEKIKWNYRPNIVGNIMVPDVLEPIIIETVVGAGSGSAAGAVVTKAPAVTSSSAGRASGVPFVTKAEKRIEFTAKFYYLPKLYVPPQVVAKDKEE